MIPTLSTAGARAAALAAVLALAACGGGDRPPDEGIASPDEGAAPPALEAAPAAVEAAPPAQPEAAETDAGGGGTGGEIDPASLSESGTIAINQYQVAFIGSGTLGKGTLRYRGQEVPFRIGGLGLGGIGIAAIDAHGTVYNLSDLQKFTGAYGNARLGLTAADKGKGRLWLKNTNGVVIKLWTKMQGLALTGGVDGIVIQWESEVQEDARKLKDGTQKAWDDVKKPFQ